MWISVGGLYVDLFRDIRGGNEDSAFRMVQDGSLRTAKKFNHKRRDQYVLQIRVFDNGAQPLYSDTYGKDDLTYLLVVILFLCFSRVLGLP